MMTFIITTLSFTVAILLASVIGCAIMFNKKVLKLYVKYIVKCMKDFEETLESAIDEEL